MIELDTYRQSLGKIRESITEVGGALNIDVMKEQLMELQETMNEPDFWNNLERSTQVSKKVRVIENKLDHYNKLITRADDIEATMELAEEMEDQDLVDEAGQEIKKLTEDLAALRLETLLRGDYDDHNAYISLHAGAGGTEAQDWTEMLSRMYQRYCERHGFDVKIIDILDGDEAGLKSITMEITGENAYGFLRGEKGVHRLVRISPFDSNARRQTSFSSLDVSPIIEDDDNEIEIDMKEYVSLVLSGEEVRSQFALKDPHAALQAGQFAMVCIVTRKADQALLIPSNSLYSDSTGKYVYLIENGKRVRQNVKVGIATDWETQITEGLEEGAVIYVKE